MPSYILLDFRIEYYCGCHTTLDGRHVAPNPTFEDTSSEDASSESSSDTLPAVHSAALFTLTFAKTFYPHEYTQLQDLLRRDRQAWLQHLRHRIRWLQGATKWDVVSVWGGEEGEYGVGNEARTARKGHFFKAVRMASLKKKVDWGDMEMPVVLPCMRDGEDGGNAVRELVELLKREPAIMGKGREMPATTYNERELTAFYRKKGVDVPVMMVDED
ncbi:MAG: hypothetical protein M1820_003295 [Bogoriella megaspora]|nr:MAG: hypothetical protein M1820_003295 [Bogoriella megaspora]